ncbi:hypothetical protein [Geobacillus icigianus]|uniref:hypothetical protein n=1 Tax=Geobacillus icigianus TaxID=1430331 RepID=UPI002D79246C|nr:hypothetical protein [Geobacillus icigianus]
MADDKGQLAGNIVSQAVSFFCINIRVFAFCFANGSKKRYKNTEKLMKKGLPNGGSFSIIKSC